ncbi:PREDICTED: uncharacterized protein LOC108663037 [Theobroma cacao]|uniref:Uncharacterized protein LOC108663037 n=1 Tax=Theobroma cacao TaxID=3641 RepID=A0AB32WRS2_THECC|nr:PREDICTED: uncharacterized protein LOC108663037 [Theobroma cacao]
MQTDSSVNSVTGYPEIEKTIRLGSHEIIEFLDEVVEKRLKGGTEGRGESLDGNRQKQESLNQKGREADNGDGPGKETGLGWNHETGTIEADATLWEAKIKVNPTYARFRYQGLEHADELEFIFGDTVTTSQNAWTLAIGIPIEDNIRSTNLTSLQDNVEFDVEEFNCDEDDGPIVNTQMNRKKMMLEEMEKKVAKGKAKIGTAASLQRILERLCEVAESHNTIESAEISMSSQAIGQYSIPECVRAMKSLQNEGRLSADEFNFAL